MLVSRTIIFINHHLAKYLIENVKNDKNFNSLFLSNELNSGSLQAIIKLKLGFLNELNSQVIECKKYADSLLININKELKREEFLSFMKEMK